MGEVEGADRWWTALESAAHAHLFVGAGDPHRGSPGRISYDTGRVRTTRGLDVHTSRLGRIPRCHPQDGGVWDEIGLQKARKRLGALRRGRTGPHTSISPQIGISPADQQRQPASSVGVARLPWPSRTDRVPCLHDGAWGPSTSITTTVPSEVLVEAAYDAGGEQPSCGGHAVESVRTTSLPSANDSARLCAPTSAPTSSAHLANIEATLRSTCQP